MSDLKSKLAIGGIVAVAYGVGAAGGYVLRGRQSAKALEKLNEEIFVLRKDIRALLETWKIEAKKAEKIIADLGKQSSMSAEQISAKLLKHGLSQTQTNTILEHLHKPADAGDTTKADKKNKTAGVTLIMAKKA